MRFNLFGSAAAATRTASSFVAHQPRPVAPALPEHGGLHAPVVSALRSVFKHFDVSSVREPISEAYVQRMIAAKQLEETFYVVDLGKVTEKWREWHMRLPRVQPFYAVKCNPDPAIVATLASFGGGFDCASSEEIELVLGMGVPAERIIYANPCKMKSHIRHARAAGVSMMTFDNAEELRKIAVEHPSAQVVLRIATDDSKSMCAFSSKFGAVRGVAPSLVDLARELGLDFAGVSFHVGSGCGDPAAYGKAIHDARNLFDHAAAVGLRPHVLDIGGGFPGIDPQPGHGISFAEIADAVHVALETHFPARPGLRIISEPGRYFSAASHTLAVNIHSKRSLAEQTGTQRKNLYYVDDGVYQSFNCIFFDHQHPVPTPVLAPPAELAGMIELDSAAAATQMQHGFVDTSRDMQTLYPSKIFGPTCDSMDCVADNLMLPELKVGDWLLWRGMGSYTRASASNFNGFSKPTPHYVCTDTHILNGLLM